MSDYFELGTMSAFTFLGAASLPEDLAARAAELDLPAVALTDRGGVYGLPRFQRAMRLRGLRPICGAILGVAGLGEIRLLCESRRGYQNLCRLITLGHAGRPKGECVVLPPDLEAHADGLTCLVGPHTATLNIDSITPLKRIYSLRFIITSIDARRAAARG